MKKIFGVTLLLVLIGGAQVLAESMYVSNIMEITVRTGRGIDHKIIAMAESGLKVELLQKEKQWSLIRLPNNKEGWVLSRFLIAEKPDNVLFGECLQQKKSLKARYENFDAASESLQSEIKDLKQQLEAKDKQAETLRAAYANLKKESADYLKNRENYLSSTKRLTDLKKKYESVEQQLADMEFKQNIRWFLSGGGVLLVGFIIGYSAKRQRRRSSLLD